MAHARFPRCLALIGTALILPGSPPAAEDCNANGVEDALEIQEAGDADCDRDGVLDSCQVAPPAVRFVAATAIETLFVPSSLEPGDLDGDGDIDLIVTPGGGLEHVTVFLNDGDGEFPTARTQRIGTIPRSPKVGDVDGDGDLDLLDPHHGQIAVLLSDGNGHFVPGETVSYPFSIGRETTTLGDLDADGDLDVVAFGTSSPGGTGLFVFRNRGDGTYEVPPEPALLVGNLSWGRITRILPGDVDGDGHLDLVLTGILIALNDGSGGFSPERTVELPQTSPVAAGDLDGDGDVDLLVSRWSERSTLEVLMNDGSAGFTVGQILEQPDGALADLDGDGDLDVYWRSSASLNNGTGRFGDPFAAHEFRLWPSRPRAVDLDGDGVPELAAAVPPARGIAILRNEPFADSDCDRNGVPDVCEGTAIDCDGNGRSDLCDVLSGRSADCNGNFVPDDCELASGADADCNDNGVLDACDIASGRSLDLVANGIPDECDFDCNENGINDGVEIAAGAPDCNKNGIPDECDVVSGLLLEDRPFPGPQPRGRVAPVDLDGDGDLDLAAAAEFRVDLFENLGRRRFRHLARHRVGAAPVAITAADFDGDGDLDLATANGFTGELPGNVSVFLNDGRGRLSPPVNRGVGHAPIAIRAMDVDGDGVVDLVVRHYVSGDLSFLFGDGEGRFAAEVRHPAFGNWSSFAVADIDGDGDQDFLSTAKEGIILLRNATGGAFDEDVLDDPPIPPRQLAAADVDTDGAVDLVVTGDGIAGIALYRNDGAGRLALWSRVDLWTQSDVIPVDLDADGDVDLLAGTGHQRYSLLLNHGRGSFALIPNLVRGSIVAIADLDGDERRDLVTSLEGEVRVLFNPIGPSARDCNGNGVPDDCDVALGVVFEEMETIASGARSVVAADLDLDGRRQHDLVVLGGGSSGFSVFLARDSGFQAAGRYLEGEEARVVVAAELDGDGLPDLAAATARNELVVYRNGGGGFFFTQREVYAVGEQPSAIAAGDFDGDGLTDLAVATRARTADVEAGVDAHALELWTGRGLGRLVRRGDVPVACCPADAAAGDLDGDGDIDLAVASDGRSCGACEGARLTLLFGDGAGGFAPRVIENVGERELPDLELADVDGNGLLDLVTARNVYLNRDGGTTLARKPYPTKGTSFATADIDLDGDVDVLVNTVGGGFTLHRNRGDGSFAAVPIPWETGSFGIAAGDFDGDGDFDAVLTSFADGAVRILRNDSWTPLSGDLDADRVPDECRARPPFHRGDPNGDGRADITDGVVLVGFLFLAPATLPCAEAADVNNDGAIDVADAISLFRFLLQAGPAPAPPGPPGDPCGFDPDPPGSEGDRGCESYDRC